MACCEASGVCYCQHNHTVVSEPSGADAPASAQAAELTAAVINRSCPAQCAQLPAGFQKQSIARAQAPRFAFITGANRRLFIHTPFLARDTLVAEAHSPRAPPAILL
jgi:hypothetical protein